MAVDPFDADGEPGALLADNTPDPDRDESRLSAFGNGYGAQAGMSPGLISSQQQAASMTSDRFRPNGLHQQLAPSGDGSSEQDRGRMVAGGEFVPTSNGIAEDTYEKVRPFLSTSIGMGGGA